jgi:hypothetical protein
MSKLTKGDCAVLFGKKWASEQGIQTAEDMAQPATAEQAALAKRFSELPKPAPAQGRSR